MFHVVCAAAALSANMAAEHSPGTGPVCAVAHGSIRPPIRPACGAALGNRHPTRVREIGT